MKNFIVLASVAISFNAFAQQWIQMSPSTPPTPRYSCAMVYDSENDRIVIFGGYRTGEWFNDVWEYDLNNDTCIQKSSLPDLGRVAPAMAYDSHNDKIILFGGYTATLPEPQPNSTWEYDLNTDTWTQKFPANSPIGRTGLTMVYDSESEKIVMFGGYRVHPEVIFYNDIWIYDLSTNTWTEMFPDTSPPARKLHVMAYDSQSDRIVLFGGETGGPILEDAWEYDLNTNTWTEKSSLTHPLSIGYRCGMAYDSHRDITVLFARPNEPQTWEYDLEADTWTQIAVSNSPSIRSCTRMAYDSESEMLVLFGGNYGTDYYNDIWVYEPIIGVEDELTTVVESKLIEVFPNPFSYKTVIKCQVTGEKKSRVLTIYDVSGRLISTIDLSNLGESVKYVSWNGRDMANREVNAGVYFLKTEGCAPVKVMKIK